MKQLEVRSPYDGRLIQSVAVTAPADVDGAVRRAAGALRDGPLPAWRRAAILDAAVQALVARKEEFAALICAEAAKPIRLARVEVDRAVSTFAFAAATARTFTGEMVPLDAAANGEGRIGFTLRVPVGVVGAITPFNFPLNMPAHKIAPAIVAGCPVVLKPAEQTPLTSLRLAELLVTDAGLPADHLQVVVGGGELGAAIVEHPLVALVTFTGSATVGWHIRERVPKKPVCLELGNNAPVIVEPDADVETAASKVAVGGFAFSGQACISTQRVLVHSSVVDRFTDALVDAVAHLRVGAPDDESTDISSLISERESARVLSWIDEATSAGARVAVGDGRTADGVVRPTVLADVTPDMRVCADEVFGPLVGVASYETFDEALRLANDTRFGLQAGVFTRDLGRALQAARTLDFGGVIVNDVPTWRADHQPYGGLRDSGNTREGPRYTAEAMTETRMVVLAG